MAFAHLSTVQNHPVLAKVSAWPAITKSYRLGGLEPADTYLSQFWRRKSETERPGRPGSGEDPLLGCRQLRLIVSSRQLLSQYPHVVGRELSGVSLKGQ